MISIKDALKRAGIDLDELLSIFKKINSTIHSLPDEKFDPSVLKDWIKNSYDPVMYQSHKGFMTKKNDPIIQLLESMEAQTKMSEKQQAKGELLWLIQQCIRIKDDKPSISFRYVFILLTKVDQDFVKYDDETKNLIQPLADFMLNIIKKVKDNRMIGFFLSKEDRRLFTSLEQQYSDYLKNILVQPLASVDEVTLESMDDIESKQPSRNKTISQPSSDSDSDSNSILAEVENPILDYHHWQTADDNILNVDNLNTSKINLSSLYKQLQSLDPSNQAINQTLNQSLEEVKQALRQESLTSKIANTINTSYDITLPLFKKTVRIKATEMIPNFMMKIGSFLQQNPKLSLLARIIDALDIKYDATLIASLQQRDIIAYAHGFMKQQQTIKANDDKSLSLTLTTPMALASANDTHGFESPCLTTIVERKTTFSEFSQGKWASLPDSSTVRLTQIKIGLNQETKAYPLLLALLSKEKPSNQSELLSEIQASQEQWHLISILCPTAITSQPEQLKIDKTLSKDFSHCGQLLSDHAIQSIQSLSINEFIDLNDKLLADSIPWSSTQYLRLIGKIKPENGNRNRALQNYLQSLNDKDKIHSSTPDIINLYQQLDKISNRRSPLKRLAIEQKIENLENIHKKSRNNQSILKRFMATLGNYLIYAFNIEARPHKKG